MASGLPQDRESGSIDLEPDAVLLHDVFPWTGSIIRFSSSLRRYILVVPRSLMATLIR